MKNSIRTSVLVISLALISRSLSSQTFSAMTVEAQVSPVALPGGITGLPVNTASQNIGNGSLLTPAASLNLGGFLALPQSPIVTAPNASSVRPFAAEQADVPGASVQAFTEPGGIVTPASVQAALTGSQVAKDMSRPEQDQPATMTGKLKNFVAAGLSRLSLEKMFDRSASVVPADGAASGAAQTAAASQNPVQRVVIAGDGIFRRGETVAAETQKMVELLKEAGHQILDVEILARNGYGTVLRTAVVHRAEFAINEEVTKAAKTTSVAVDGLAGGDSVRKIAEMVRMLKSADQMILDVSVTGRNGYGKILSANIVHISKYAYDQIMDAPRQQSKISPDLERVLKDHEHYNVIIQLVGLYDDGMMPARDSAMIFLHNVIVYDRLKVKYQEGSDFVVLYELSGARIREIASLKGIRRISPLP